MCYVIFTCRTLLWALLTLLATLVVAVSIITPQWLVGPLRKVEGVGPAPLGEELLSPAAVSDGGGVSPLVYAPTLGLYASCTKITDFDGLLEMYSERLSFTVDQQASTAVNGGPPDLAAAAAEYVPYVAWQRACAPFVSGRVVDNPDRQMSHFWKVSLMLMGLGLVLLLVTVATSLLSFCVRSACNNKSLFTVSGLIQAIAGLLFVIALIVYPAGWSSERVDLMCGAQAGPYLIGECSLGWAFYLAVSGTVLTFLCAIMSIQADISTSSDKVQEEIYKGKVCICLA